MNPRLVPLPERVPVEDLDHTARRAGTMASKFIIIIQDLHCTVHLKILPL